ncbi:MAG: class I SAM-dependent methyltransferase [Candidatus Hadarchaeales archaeon]
MDKRYAGSMKIVQRVAEFLTNTLDKHLPAIQFFTERIVEYPFVHSNIERKGKILDVGCGKSFLPFELASRGHEVYGIDLIDYPHSITHPNFKYIRGDARKMPFKSSFFDVVVSVSVLEHLVEFGPNEDERVVDEIARVLKPNGKFILTLPFVKRMIFRGKIKVYDLKLLKELLTKLEIIKIEFAKKKGEVWVPASLKEVENLRHPKSNGWPCSRAIALVVAKKR